MWNAVKIVQLQLLMFPVRGAAGAVTLRFIFGVMTILTYIAVSSFIPASGLNSERNMSVCSDCLLYMCSSYPEKQSIQNSQVCPNIDEGA
jgi:hypothetical protein